MQIFKTFLYLIIMILISWVIVYLMPIKSFDERILDALARSVRKLDPLVEQEILKVLAKPENQTTLSDEEKELLLNKLK